MFKILTLICAAGTDPSACTINTALDVVQGPAVSLQQCMFLGQAQIAPTSLAPEAGKQTVKVVCRPATTTTAER